MPVPGDFRYFQCSQPCHDKLYENHGLVEDMLKSMNGLEVPSELIPRCPVCGWKNGSVGAGQYIFYRAKHGKIAYRRYENFVRKNQDKKAAPAGIRSRRYDAQRD